MTTGTISGMVHDSSTLGKDGDSTTNHTSVPHPKGCSFTPTMVQSFGIFIACLSNSALTLNLTRPLISIVLSHNVLGCPSLAGFHLPPHTLRWLGCKKLLPCISKVSVSILRVGSLRR